MLEMGGAQGVRGTVTEDGAGEAGATSHKVPEPESAFIPRAEQ